jgi:tetratricopeptide (TPR) repeat protein
MDQYHEEILAEVKKVSAWADLSRQDLERFKRMNRVVGIVALAIVACAIVVTPIAVHYLDRKTENETSWYTVNDCLWRGEINKAIQIGQKLIEKTPGDPAAHRILGGAYLIAGQLEASLDHYEQAYRLFPSDQNKSNIETVKGRIEEEKSRTSGNTPTQ